MVSFKCTKQHVQNLTHHRREYSKELEAERDANWPKNDSIVVQGVVQGVIHGAGGRRHSSAHEYCTLSDIRVVIHV